MHDATRLLPSRTGSTFEVPRSGIHEADRLAASFLARYRNPNTRVNYAIGLKQWFRYCVQLDLNPLAVERAHIDLWGRMLEETHGLKASTVAGKLNVVAQYYKTAMIDGVLNRNPAEFITRPQVPRVSSSDWLRPRELFDVLESAKKTHPRDYALISLLGLNGLRVGEACSLDVTNVHRSGPFHVVDVVTEKNGDPAEVPFSFETSWAIERCLGGRTSGPLFLKRNETRLDRKAAARILTKHCRACGITRRITPHSLRHSYTTIALNAGVPPREVQRGGRWRDLRFVTYYDRGGQSHMSNPTHAVTAAVAGAA